MSTIHLPTEMDLPRRVKDAKPDRGRAAPSGPLSIAASGPFCWPTWLSSWRDGDEEWVNAITHGLGFVLALVGAAFVVRQSTAMESFLVQAACWVYASTLIGVYLASTLSHIVREPSWKYRFAVWDQGVIYLYIAGTFTPFAAKYLMHDWWPLVIFMMWFAAIAGFVSKVLLEHRIQGIAIWIYVALGWAPVLSFPELYFKGPVMGLAWGLAGGVAYSVGAMCLVRDRSVPYLHTAWHLLVIVGSACHWYAVRHYVIHGV